MVFKSDLKQQCRPKMQFISFQQKDILPESHVQPMICRILQHSYGGLISWLEMEHQAKIGSYIPRMAHNLRLAHILSLEDPNIQIYVFQVKPGLNLSKLWKFWGSKSGTSRPWGKPASLLKWTDIRNQKACENMWFWWKCQRKWFFFWFCGRSKKILN